MSFDRKIDSTLRAKLGAADYNRLAAISNTRLHRFVADAIALCDPETVVVPDDSSASPRADEAQGGRGGRGDPARG